MIEVRENEITEMFQLFEEGQEVVQDSEEELENALQEAYSAKEEVKRLKKDKTEQDTTARVLSTLNREWFKMEFPSSQNNPAAGTALRMDAL